MSSNVDPSSFVNERGAMKPASDHAADLAETSRFSLSFSCLAGHGTQEFQFVHYIPAIRQQFTSNFPSLKPRSISLWYGKHPN
jgi:hypothetical protein